MGQDNGPSKQMAQGGVSLTVVLKVVGLNLHSLSTKVAKAAK